MKIVDVKAVPASAGRLLAEGDSAVEVTVEVVHKNKVGEQEPAQAEEELKKLGDDLVKALEDPAVIGDLGLKEEDYVKGSATSSVTVARDTNGGILGDAQASSGSGDDGSGSESTESALVVILVVIISLIVITGLIGGYFLYKKKLEKERQLLKAKQVDMEKGGLKEMAKEINDDDIPLPQPKNDMGGEFSTLPLNKQ